jgi:hypothetical protein
VAALADGGKLCVCDLAWILERAPRPRLTRPFGCCDRRVWPSLRDAKMVMYSLTDRGRELLAAAVGEVRA